MESCDKTFNINIYIIINNIKSMEGWRVWKVMPKLVILLFIIINKKENMEGWKVGKVIIKG